MKKVTKKLQRFIDSISIIGDSKIIDDDCKIYYSKIDGSYLTRSGMENELNFLLKNGITDFIQNCHGKSTTSNIGFNPTEQNRNGMDGHIGQFMVLGLVLNVKRVCVDILRVIGKSLLNRI